MQIIIPYEINPDGTVKYPEDIDCFSNTLISDDGKYLICDYKGNKSDYPLYTPPVKTERVITPIEFEMRLPNKMRVLLADPSLALNPDGSPNIELRARCAIFARMISLSQAVTSKGDKGVDLDNPATKQGLNEAMQYGLFTETEVSEVLK